MNSLMISLMNKMEFNKDAICIFIKFFFVMIIEKSSL